MNLMNHQSLLQLAPTIVQNTTAESTHEFIKSVQSKLMTDNFVLRQKCFMYLCMKFYSLSCLTNFKTSSAAHPTRQPCKSIFTFSPSTIYFGISSKYVFSLLTVNNTINVSFIYLKLA
jgi:hypothetical protein